MRVLLFEVSEHVGGHVAALCEFRENRDVAAFSELHEIVTRGG